MFVLIHLDTSGGDYGVTELRTVRLISDRAAANDAFDEMAASEELVETVGDNLAHECEGTIRAAGDDVSSLHLFDLRPETL